ncbi:MAG TPA: hypothetical protein DIW47_13655 [Bacteroidetes bacterium]|nr:hypothetical protein [Bacteroidota bacterium]
MTQEVNAQSLRMDVRNQQYSGDTLFFDIYLSRNGGSADYYLGDADFVLNYNNANFSTPTIGYVSGSNVLKNHTGSATSTYNGNIAAALGSSNPNTNKIMINVLQPSFGNQTQFESNIARIDTNQLTHRLGTFWIKGLQDKTQSPSLTWVTAGAGIRTTVYTLNTSTPWKSNRISSLDANNPTIGTEPSTQVTAMSVTTKTDTSISLSWTRGNGNDVVVLAKQGSAVGTDLPTDGIAYDADSFGVGSQIGSTGVYVVYRGTATSTTVLKLDPETHYYFAAVEVYGENGHNENYRASSPATANDTTKAGEPGTSATNLQITAFTTTTLDLSWTNGSGANRIVVAKSGSAVSVNPTDAVAYTADGDFTAGEDLGSGNIVVYDGSGSTASISGLTANTEYHFAVYEYNGSNGARNYKIDTPAVNDRFTLQTEPTTASIDADFSNIAPTSMTFSFTGGNGAKRIILIHSGAAVDADPADGEEYTASTTFAGGDTLGTGNYVIYAADSNFVTVTGLTANTTYHYEVFEYNGTGEAANYLTSSTLTGSKTTTEAEPATSATALTFTAFSTTTLDLSWTNGDGANRIVVARATSAVDFTPVDTNAYTANASFSSGTGLGGSNDNYVVYNGSGSSVQVTNLTPNTEYHFAVYEYNGSGGAQNYKIDTPAVNDRFTLQTEPTVASSGPAFTSISTTGMTFHFTDGDGANRIILIHAGAAVDADPVDGTAYTANSAYSSGDQIGTGNYVVYAGSDTFVSVTGLTANTTYHYEVFEVNGSGESNNYLTSSSLVADEITLQSAPTIPASLLTISNVTTNSMGLRWTKGNGDARVVVARAVSTVSSDPVNGTTYTANATFGSGDTVSAGQYIVYDGTDSVITVTGLSQDTSYFFAVYEYNGTAGSQNYLTTTPATADSNTAIQLNITALLEGPFNGTTMDTVLNEIDSIPLSQPYNTAPWNYAGTENITAVPYDVVDWVYVQVRRAATAAGALTDSVVAEQAGFLMADGLIMDSTGVTEMKLHPSQAGYGQLYVVVYHRNHIGVMSATTMSYSSDSSGFVFDFTTGAGQAYGTAALVLSGSRYVMYTGNADASGSAIDADDRDAAWDARNAYGYRQEDVNMDGNVTSSDRSAVYNNTGQDEQIP